MNDPNGAFDNLKFEFQDATMIRYKTDVSNRDHFIDVHIQFRSIDCVVSCAGVFNEWPVEKTIEWIWYATEEFLDLYRKIRTKEIMEIVFISLDYIL